MKEYKSAGRFTNENIQRAMRSPEKATIVEALVTVAVTLGTEYVADLAWDGSKYIAKKIYDAFTKKKETPKEKKKGGKK